MILKANCGSYHDIPTAEGIVYDGDVFSNHHRYGLPPYLSAFIMLQGKAREDWLGESKISNLGLENVLKCLARMPPAHGWGV